MSEEERKIMIECPKCGHRITPDFRVLPQGLWTANDLLQLATILTESKMSLGDLLRELREAALLITERRREEP